MAPFVFRFVLSNSAHFPLAASPCISVPFSSLCKEHFYLYFCKYYLSVFLRVLVWTPVPSYCPVQSASSSHDPDVQLSFAYGLICINGICLKICLKFHLCLRLTNCYSFLLITICGQSVLSLSIRSKVIRILCSSSLWCHLVILCPSWTEVQLCNWMLLPIILKCQMIWLYEGHKVITLLFAALLWW